MADRVPVRIPPEPEALAAMMRGRAEAFVAMANGTLDWGPEAGYAIDGWCAHFLPSMPARPGIRAGVAFAMGAYLGELIVRHAGGRWVYDERTQTAGVDIRDRRFFPLNMARKRVDGQPGRSLSPAYHFALTGLFEPGTSLTPREAPGDAGGDHDMRLLAASEQAGDVPSDEDLAAHMLRYAQLFLEAAASVGDDLGWSVSEVHRLDQLCDEYLATGLPEDGYGRMSLIMGAYLGELIARYAGGIWRYDRRFQCPGLDMPGGHRVFPQNRVGRRLAQGREYSLADFYQLAVTGQQSNDTDAGPA
jgi:hypothetical protein